MFDFHSPASYLALALAAFVIGFGWTIGCIVAGTVNNLHRERK